MPGGLTRVATGPDARVVSMQRGGASKDTWVLASGPVSAFSLLRRPTTPQDLVRTGINFSSRVVENLFWFGRHAERSDAVARLLRVALGHMIDESTSERERAWPESPACSRTSRSRTAHAAQTTWRWRAPCGRRLRTSPSPALPAT